MSHLTREPVYSACIFKLPVATGCWWLLWIKGSIFTATTSACINRHQRFLWEAGVSVCRGIRMLFSGSGTQYLQPKDGVMDSPFSVLHGGRLVWRFHSLEVEWEKCILHFLCVHYLISPLLVWREPINLLSSHFQRTAFHLAAAWTLLNGKENWKQAAVWVICKLSEITVFLLRRLSDWQYLPPDSQLVGTGRDGAVQNYLSLSFFFGQLLLNETRINFSWAIGLAQSRCTCCIYGFCKYISSLFLLCLSWSLWNFRFLYLVSFDKSRSTRQPGIWESSLQMRSRGCSKWLVLWTGDQGWGRRPAAPMLCPWRMPLAWGHCSPLSPPVDEGFSALALLTPWPE